MTTTNNVPAWKAQVLAQLESARSFADLLAPLPAKKPQGAYVEIGEWDQVSDAYPWEGQGDLLLAPDGQVFVALNVPPEQIPDGGDK
jgi:hypothetical protein